MIYDRRSKGGSSLRLALDLERGELKDAKSITWFVAKRLGTLKKLDTDKLKAEEIKVSVI